MMRIPPDGDPLPGTAFVLVPWRAQLVQELTAVASSSRVFQRFLLGSVLVKVWRSVARVCPGADDNADVG